jgi:hypothetical protein
MKLLQRIQSQIATKSQAHDKLEDMLIELRGRGINFNIQKVEEEGQVYYVAKSVDYPRGSIITSGSNVKELENNIKDAIFTAFEVPARFCHPALINIKGGLFANQSVHATT